MGTSIGYGFRTLRFFFFGMGLASGWTRTYVRILAHKFARVKCR